MLNWFLSSAVRQARQMCSHARKLVAAQRDLLSPQAIGAVEASITSLDQSTRGKLDVKVIEQRMTELEKVAVKWIKPYPNASYRENVEVLLVAIAVAMGIRTFILQPFKIPTGSMQPTLYGVTTLDLGPNPQIPGFLKRMKDFVVSGISYYHVVAENDGVFSIVDQEPSRFLLFNLRQRFRIGDQVYSVWFPPEDLWKHAGLGGRNYPERHPEFKKGQDVLCLAAVAGDHLFVDRVTYNFRRPNRGDIVVFRTSNIRSSLIPDDQHYIKRLIGLPGETVQIGNDHHVVIDGKRLDSMTPHFAKVYDEAHWNAAGGYFGHVNASFRPLGMVFFQDETYKFPVPPRQYLVMGDNTLNSSDSRYWGSFPRENILGKSFFVYWPFNSRWGCWGHE
jgi:signal peptidase I